MENGDATYSMVFEKGNYTLIATYLGDDVFNTNTTSQDFEIIGHVMKDTPINAQADVNGYKVTITVNVDDNATGFVEVKYEDTIINIALTNGTGTYAATLPAGSYNVDVTYLGDDNFNVNSTKLSFTVDDPVKENTPISIDVSSVENNVTYAVNVDSNASGIVRFDVSGDAEYVVYADVINGVAVMRDVLEVGDYTVVATYMGDDRFNSNVTSESFTVKGHVKKDTPISAVVKVNGNKVTITVNVNESASGFVGLTQSGSTIYVALENGVATYTDTVPAGSYNVEVAYAGDDNFNVNSTRVLFTVVEFAKENTTIVADASVVGNNVTLTVLVNEDATGIVKLVLTGSEENTLYVDVVGGKAVLEVVLESGNYTIVATYMGDDRFNSNVTSVTVNVGEKQDANVSISIPSGSIKVGDTVTVEIVIPNATGNVSVIYEGIETVVTLQNGTATVPINNVGVGEHSIEVYYSGDDTHAAAYNSTSIKVDKLGSSFNATEGMTIETYTIERGAGELGALYAFKLTDSNGNPITNANITFAYKDVIFYSTTNENGIVYLGVSTYISQTALCALSYLGDETHDAAFVAFNFKIKQKPTTIKAYRNTFKVAKKNKYYTVTLKTIAGASRDGKVYLGAGKVLTLKVNGVTYKAKTNAKGQATFKINKLNKKGKYVAVVNFAGKDPYAGSTKKVIIVVK